MELLMVALDDGALDALPSSTASRVLAQTLSAAYREEPRPVVSGLGDIPCDTLGDLDLDDVAARHAGGDVLVVARAATVTAYVARVLDVAVGRLSPAAHGSISRVRASRSGQRNLISYSDTLHLAVASAASPEEEPQCRTSMSS